MCMLLFGVNFFTIRQMVYSEKLYIIVTFYLSFYTQTKVNIDNLSGHLS